MDAVCYRFVEIAVDDQGDGVARRIVGKFFHYGDTAELPGFRERILPGALKFGDVIAKVPALLHSTLQLIARVSVAELQRKLTGTPSVSEKC